MTDPVPSKGTCHVCDTPDGDHLDWCTPQAREQRPSKDLVSELRGPDEAGYITASRAIAANEIERLRTALRGIQSCSTCEACRGAATLALGDPLAAETRAATSRGAHSTEDAGRPRPSSEPAVSPERAFELGWRTAANWLEREDLIVDIGSPAYDQDKANALGAAQPPGAGEEAGR